MRSVRNRNLSKMKINEKTERTFQNCTRTGSNKSHIKIFHRPLPGMEADRTESENEGGQNTYGKPELHQWRAQRPERPLRGRLLLKRYFRHLASFNGGPLSDLGHMIQSKPGYDNPFYISKVLKHKKERNRGGNGEGERSRLADLGVEPGEQFCFWRSFGSRGCGSL